jgi:hypothetical protein
MMIRTTKVVRSATVILLAPFMLQLACLAQVDAWERIKLIEPGRSVHVKVQSGKTVKGKFESWSPDKLGLRQGKDRVVDVGRAEVVRIAVVTGRSRRSRAGYAGLIGGAVGAGLLGVACAAGSGCDVSPGAMAAGGALYFGGIAAAIAALIPQHKDVIYAATPDSTNLPVPAAPGSGRE